MGCGGSRPDGCAAELSEILEVSASRDRGRCLIDYLDRTAPDALPEVLETFRASRLELDEIAAGSLASWWATFDPQSAFLEGRGVTGIDSTVWAAMVVREWTLHAPDSALRVVARSASQGEAGWSRALTHALIQSWFVGGHPPEDLFPMLKNLTPGRPQKEALDNVLERALEYQGWDAATQMVEGIPEDSEPHFRQIVFQRMASVLVVRDAERAVRWVTPHANKSYGRLLFRRLARRWARKEGQKAVEWIRTLELPAEEKDSILGEAYRVWQNTSGESAREWLSSQPFSPELSLALERMVSAMARSGEAEAALAIVETTPDPGVQTRLRIAAGRAWLATAPEEANRWLAESKLPRSVIAEIRRPAPGPPRQSPARAPRAPSPKRAEAPQAG